MKIVVDIGCADQGAEYSCSYLLNKFKPDIYYGFDPHPNVLNLTRPAGYEGEFHVEQKAAWLNDLGIWFSDKGDRSFVTLVSPVTTTIVDTFSLTDFIRDLDGEIVLKLDCEGAEIELLKNLYRHGMDNKLTLLLVEWHCANCGTGGGEHTEECPYPAIQTFPYLNCPVEEW